VCEAPAGMLLRDLAECCASAFSITPRVWGDRAATLARIVTATGSAGSLIPAALTAGADALVAGEVRYHDALDAAEAGLAIVEIGHDVSEWPLVSLLEDAVRGVEGLPASHVKVLPARPGWWTP